MAKSFKNKNLEKFWKEYKRKPFTPGEILLEEFMEPYDLTQLKLAELIGITRRRVNEIVNGKRGVTPDTALRLAKLFSMSPDYWLNLQIKTDIWNTLQKKREQELIRKIKPLKIKLAAAAA